MLKNRTLLDLFVTGKEITLTDGDQEEENKGVNMCCICRGACSHSGPHQYCEAHKPTTVCPHCGYCQYCGRGNYRPAPYIPYWPVSPWPLVTWGTTTSGAAQVTFT